MTLTCPHCGLDALSPLRKLALGPVATASCQRCGLKVSTAVPASLLAFVPCLVAIVVVLSGALRGTQALVLTGLAGWAATAIVYLLWVPLVRRQVTRQDAVAAARAAASGPR